MKKQMEWQDIKEICSKHEVDYENLRKQLFWVDGCNGKKFEHDLSTLKWCIKKRNQYNFDLSYHVIESLIINLFKK
jgi:hypothetical protein